MADNPPSSLYEVHSAMIQGSDHAKEFKNRQDHVIVRHFPGSLMRKGKIYRAFVGAICDGCGEGSFSEVGATLLARKVVEVISNMIFDESTFDDKEMRPPLYLAEDYKDAASALVVHIPLVVLDLIPGLVSLIYGEDRIDKERWCSPKTLSFVRDHLLSTLIVVVGIEDRIYVAHQGDGIIYASWGKEFADESGATPYVLNIIDQNNRPSYPAYGAIPASMLEDGKSELEPLKVHYMKSPEVVIVSTDGAKRFFTENRTIDLINTKGNMGLQRRLNSGHLNFHPSTSRKPEWEVKDDAAIITVKRIVGVESFGEKDDSPTSCEL